MRRIALLLLLGVLFTAAACGDEDTATDEDSTPTVEVEATNTQPPPATNTPPPLEPTNTPVPAEPTEPPAQQQRSGDGLQLRVSVFDDTVSRPVDALEVWLRGYGSWYPDVSFGSDVVTYEMAVTEGQPYMFIYPDGRDGGVEIPVTFEIPADFNPGSVRDMLQVSVSDTTVTVFGTVMPGLELEFAR